MLKVHIILWAPLWAPLPAWDPFASDFTWGHFCTREPLPRSEGSGWSVRALEIIISHCGTRTIALSHLAGIKCTSATIIRNAIERCPIYGRKHVTNWEYCSEARMAEVSGWARVALWEAVGLSFDEPSTHFMHSGQLAFRRDLFLMKTTLCLC